MKAILVFHNNNDATSSRAVRYGGKDTEEKGKRNSHSFGVNLQSDITDRKAVSKEIDSVNSLLSQGRNGNGGKRRRFRSMEISVSGSTAEGASEEEISEALTTATKDFLKTYAPRSKAICDIHFDTQNPHARIVFDAADASRMKRHDWTRKDISEMQDFNFTRALDSGKGTRNKSYVPQSDYGKLKKRMKDGRRKTDIDYTQDVILPKVKERLAELSLDKKEHPKSKEDLLELLLEAPDRLGLDLKYETKNKKRLKQPSIIRAGGNIRLSRVFDLLRDKPQKAKKKAKNKAFPKKDNSL